MKIRNYISHWSDNYQQTFQRTRIISQIPAFILAVTILLEVGSIYFSYSTRAEVDWLIITNATIKGFFLFALFAARFILLFLKSKTSFWISQAVWLVYFIVLWNTFAQFNGCLYYLPNSVLFVLLYLYGSLVRQIISIGYSILITFKK